MKLKELVIFGLLLLCINIGYSQQFKKLDIAKKESPTVIFNDLIIGNLKMIDSSETSNIKEINVQKYLKQDDPHLNHVNNLGEFGIIWIRWKEMIQSKSQAEMNAFFGLEVNNPIYIDGYLIENPNHVIAVEALFEVEKVVTIGENKLEVDVLNVWTLDKWERNGTSTIFPGIIPKSER
jgi:hypothetical protein